MRNVLPFNRFDSLQALMQSEDVVCLSSHPWDEVQPVYGAALAAMAEGWRVFFFEHDRLSLAGNQDLSNAGIGNNAGVRHGLGGAATRTRQAAPGVWLVQLLIALGRDARSHATYDVLRKRRLLSEFLHEASVHEPLVWCLDVQAVALARGLPAALAVFSGDSQLVERVGVGPDYGASASASAGLVPGSQTVQTWADLVLPETAFSDAGTEFNLPCPGVQAIVDALSARLAVAGV